MENFYFEKVLPDLFQILSNARILSIGEKSTFNVKYCLENF